MISIRPAVPTDNVDLQELFMQLGYKNSPASIASRINTITSNEAILVADLGENLCGVIVLNFITPLHEDARWGLISALVVSENERGSGIGQQLLFEAETVAKAYGCTQIELASSMKRERAHKFYESQGYQEKRKRFIKLLL